MQYRRDIDGLRAFAILPVIFYHLDVPFFTGGYVGVDIFFVISGFLITSILLRDLEQGKFSLWNFYERRCRRILPALIFSALLTCLLGVLILFPEDIRMMGRSLIATMLFLSNVLFYRQSGYFDTSAETKPLLHTWSLAIEEQFYVVFPILFFIIFSKAHKHILTVLLFLASFSCIFAIIQVYFSSAAAFFLMPARAWELLTGSCIAIFSRVQLGKTGQNWAILYQNSYALSSM